MLSQRLFPSIHNKNISVSGLNPVHNTNARPMARSQTVFEVDRSAAAGMGAAEAAQGSRASEVTQVINSADMNRDVAHTVPEGRLSKDK